MSPNSASFQCSKLLLMYLYVQVSTIRLVTANESPPEISSSLANRTNTTTASAVNPIRDASTLDRQTLTNHRVEGSQQSAPINKSLPDFIPEASMLKPQLALQIIASSAPQMSHQFQSQHQYQPSSEPQMSRHQLRAQQDANTRYLEPDWPAYVNQNLDATIVVPSGQSPDHGQQLGRLSKEAQSSSNSLDMNQNDQMQSQSMQNFDGPPLIEAKSNSELNSWRYVTDGLGVPTLRDSQIGDVGADSSRQVDANDKSQVKSISGGNIVVSMNLSGDEIIITPMATNDDNAVNVTTDSTVDRSVEQDENSESKATNNSHRRIRLSPSKRNSKTKNSGKQITVELEDGQQSASELVIVDEDDEEDEGGDAGAGQLDNEDKAESEHNLARRTSKRSNVDRSSPTSANQLDSETRETRLSKGLSQPGELAESSRGPTNDEAGEEAEDPDDSEAEDAQEHASNNEYATEERAPRNQSSKRANNLSAKAAGSSSSDNPRYSVAKLGRKLNNMHDLKSKSASSARDNGPNWARDRVSSDRGSKRDNYQRKSSPTASSIIVKSDDLRKFELLLESLRSISLESLKASNVKHRQPKVRTAFARSDENGLDNNSRGSSEVHQLRPRHGKRASSARPKGMFGANRMVSRVADAGHRSTDCSQKDENSQLIADGTIVLQSQDPEQSASNAIDSNSQTATFEIEESTDDDGKSGAENQNDDNLISLTTTETLAEAPNNQQNESNIQQGVQPNDPQFRPFFVRKTLLQNYLKSSDEANNRGQDGYIDYNQLDNREVYRAADGPRQASRLVVTHQRSPANEPKPEIA